MTLLKRLTIVTFVTMSLVPGICAGQTILLSGNYSPLYNGTDNPWNVGGDLNVGDTAAGAMTITGAASVNNLVGSLGVDSGVSGNATITGVGSQWNNSSFLRVGFFGDGTLNVEAGGVVSSNHGFIGINMGSTGTATITGVGSQWNNFNNLFVGSSGDGTFNVEAGGVVSNTIGYIGHDAGSTGTATVNGIASQWTNSSSLTVGREGDGTLNVEAGGVVSNSDGYIGENAGSTGTVTITGAGSQWNNSNSLYVGFFGDGTLNVEAGGVVSNEFGIVGGNLGSTGTATITGVGSQWNNSNNLFVGISGDGTFNVESGALVSNAIGFIAHNSASTSTATISGAGSQWNNTDSMYIGGGETYAGGDGTLNVYSDGAITAGNLVKVWNPGQVNLADGTIDATTFEMAGGTLSGFGTVNADFIGVSTATITAQGGGVLTIGNPASTAGFSFDGTTNITSTGTLEILDTDAAELGLNTVLAGGALVARNGISLDPGDTISGYGIIIGNISGGNIPILATPSGTVDFSSTLNIEGDTATVYSFGIPRISGTVTIAGGNFVTPNGVTIAAGGTLSGFADLSGTKMSGEAFSTLTASGGTLTIGDASSFTGFTTEGTINVGSETINIGTRSYANLGQLTTLNGGTLNATNGVALGAGDVIDGYGTVNAKLALGFGSFINASGNLNLGDINSFAGFTSDGDLYTNNNTVVINDRDKANLGSYTNLGDANGGGTLTTTNGAYLDFGDTLEGYGTVNGDFTNNGHVHGEGPLPADGLVFAFGSTVDGVGSFTGIVQFDGDFNPGLSPGEVELEDFVFTSTTNLNMELGGLFSGTEYDVLTATGTGVLDGNLNVSFINGFTASLGDSFEIITSAGGFGGSDFATYNLPTLSAGLAWQVNYSTNSLALTASAIPEPSSLITFSVVLGMFTRRRRRTQ